jgi:hypothetical protein
MLNPLRRFFRRAMIDTTVHRFLVSPMRFLTLALVLLVPGASAFAQSTNSSSSTAPKATHSQTSLPRPTAEPEGGNAYAAPAPHEQEGPSEADVGPVQRRFVRASETDDMAETGTFDNASLKTQEKFALDRRISVPLIHDVQNDGGSTTSNAALAYELTYLNWGAVTEEQRGARRGHYFTITWKNSGPPADFTTRFEYREVKSQEVVRTLTQVVPHAHGAVRSYFAVTSKAYLAYGPVVSWRFTVLKGDTVVAEAKSFVW